MLPGMELVGCTNLAVPLDVMQHVVRVESAFNPFAIGVVGGRLVRQPQSLPEAVATARMLEDKGYNFSLGMAQVNRYNLKKYGLDTYQKAFDICPNLTAGARILAECYGRSGGSWGDAFSCYYSGNFVTGYRHGYVQKINASISAAARILTAPAIEVIPATKRAGTTHAQTAASSQPGVVGSTTTRRVAMTDGPRARTLRVQPATAVPDQAAHLPLPTPDNTALASHAGIPGQAHAEKVAIVAPDAHSVADQAFVF